MVSDQKLMMCDVIFTCCVRFHLLDKQPCSDVASICDEIIHFLPLSALTDG